MGNRELCYGMLASLLVLTQLPGCGGETSQTDATSTSALCDFHSGASDALIIGSTLLLADGDVDDGGLVVLASGEIGSVGEFSELAVAFPEASRLDCRGKTVLSPGWVNVHEHEAFSYAFPDPALKPVYNHRQEWILGRNNIPPLPIPADQRYAPDDPLSQALLSWVELRHLFAGTTTLGGSAAMPGLARNVGRRTDRADAAAYTFEADLEVFPFSRNAIEKFADVCRGDGLPAPHLTIDSEAELAYAPHVGEGRKSDCTASAEIDAFLAYVAEQRNSGGRFSAVHAVATGPEQLARFAELDVTLVWSPRSNLSLYGETIDLRESQRQGVRLALGTDWSPSGSFNMLEEFSCARAVAQKIADPLDAHQLWLMATRNAAYAAGIDDVVGQLAEGFYGDLLLLRKREGLEDYAVATNATVDDVALVWLDGKPIFADSEIAHQMGLDSGCAALTEEDKVICADFTALGISWEDMVNLTADAVPINGDTSRQAPCDIADLGE